MLGQCLATVYDVAPTLNQHSWFNVSCMLGRPNRSGRIYKTALGHQGGGESRMCQRRGRKAHFGSKRGVSFNLCKKCMKMQYFHKKGGAYAGSALCWIRHCQGMENRRQAEPADTGLCINVVYDAGPTLNRHWFNALCLLGSTGIF